jgi:hypothetical protein
LVYPISLGPQAFGPDPPVLQSGAAGTARLKKILANENKDQNAACYEQAPRRRDNHGSTGNRFERGRRIATPDCGLKDQGRT